MITKRIGEDRPRRIPVGARLLNARISSKTLIYFQIFYVLVILWLINDLGVPGIFLYVTDLITIISLLCCPKGSWGNFRKLGTGILVTIFGIICLVLFIGDVVHLVNPLLVLWGIRNTFRFFVFLYACVSILDKQDVDAILKMLFYFQVPNLLLTLIQYANGYYGDHLGGIFGTVTGCNGYTNVYFCILLAYQAISYVDGRDGITKLVFVAASSLFIAALAELKFYFFEVAIIAFFVLLYRINRVKTFVLFGFVLLAFFAALQVFSSVFPSAYEMLTNFDELLNYSTDSTGAVMGYNISRLNAFSDINAFIFHDNLLLNLFGIGFGNAGNSSFSFFTSDFYRVFGNLNYHFFTHQTWFIETGYVGFGLLVILFIALYLYCGKWAKRLCSDSLYFRFAQIVIIITVLCFWYNQMLRVEGAYLTFFVLSIPFILVKYSKGYNDGRSSAD